MCRFLLEILLTKENAYNKISKVAKRWAQIAQLVEQRTENPRVAGSIPALGTFQNKYLHAGVVQW